MYELLSLDSFKVILGLLSLIPILYWYLTKNFNHWTKQGISGPKPIPLFGNTLDKLTKSAADSDVEYFKKFGFVYGLFDGSKPILEIGDPNLIKLVLVKEFHRFNNRKDLNTFHPIVNKNLFNSRGEDWKKIRSITSSTFTSGKMKKMYGLVKQCLDEYLVHLNEVAVSGQPFNVKHMHENFTLDVIASCAFATQTDACKDPNNPFILNSRRLFTINPLKVIPALVFPKFINNLICVKHFFNTEANDFIVNLSKHLVKTRKESGKKNNDFLQLLMDAKGDDNKGEAIDGLTQYINEDEGIDYGKNSYANKSLTDDEIIAQSWVFLLAGFETTATTLGYISREMALNPLVQEKLYNEIKTAMGTQQEISYEDLHRLPYLEACISETLRLYPPVIRLDREVNQDFKLGDSEIRLKKGQGVEIPVYAIHRSKEYFENPNEFIPERFLPENRHKIIPYTYMPFGTGPRNCIGMRFALMEVKLAMAHIIINYRFTKCDKTEDKLNFLPGTPLLAPQSVTISIQKR